MSITIVSAFIYLATGNKSLEFYIEQGIKLLKLDIYKIIFIDEQVFTHFKDYQNDQTILIKTRIEDLYLYKYKEQLKNLWVNTDNPMKDTFDYFVIQCNKTEWIREAAEPREATIETELDQFIWLDFGIHHILPADLNIIAHSFLSKPDSNKVRIPSIWDLETYHLLDCKRDILWYFAGGVFGGPAKKIIEFADLTRAKCLQLVEQQQHLMWEVNIWYLVWQDNKSLFSVYKADHNESIISNYNNK